MRQAAGRLAAATLLVGVLGAGGYLAGWALGAPALPGRSHPSRLQAEAADPAELGAEPASNLARSPGSVGSGTPSLAPPSSGPEHGDHVDPTGSAPAGRPLLGTPAADPASPASGRPLVQFVYFVEQDQPLDPGAVALIDHQAQTLQRYWYDQFGGTFTLADQVVVMRGDHPALWYDVTTANEDARWNRLTNVTEETRTRLGLNPDDTSVRLVIYPAARLDGRVGANRYAGAVMDGDDVGCISGEVVTVPYSADYPANCLPTVAHELGHVFGLSHQGPDTDCMQFGFYQYVSGVKTCQFSDPNRVQIRSDPANLGWLAARPGDRAPGRQLATR